MVTHDSNLVNNSCDFLPVQVLTQLFYDEKAGFHLPAKSRRSTFYKDDLISRGYTIANMVEIFEQVKGMLYKGHFPSRKWCSNEPAALKGVDESDRKIC